MRPPSQPTPFSAELQTFIVTKFDPLISIVRELNDRLQVSEKERSQIERRVNILESRIRDLTTNREIDEPNQSYESLSTAEKDLPQYNDLSTAPWLFSCSKNTSTASIQVMLEFSPELTLEMSVTQWNSEEDMWLNFLEELPEDIPFVQPEDLSLGSLRDAARSALIQACKKEFLAVLRSVPGSEEAMHNKQFLLFVAILVAAFSEAWERVEHSDPNCLGRIAIVLSGSGIGTRLRAGRNKFNIEPLN